jgi:hypothetical protein
MIQVQACIEATENRSRFILLASAEGKHPRSRSLDVFAADVCISQECLSKAQPLNPGQGVARQSE